MRVCGSTKEVLDWTGVVGIADSIYQRQAKSVCNATNAALESATAMFHAELD
jgi:hypothetical protein